MPLPCTIEHRTRAIRSQKISRRRLWVQFYITAQIEPVIRPCSKLRREPYLSNHHQKVASADSLGKAEAAKSIIFRLVFVVIELFFIFAFNQPIHQISLLWRQPSEIANGDSPAAAMPINLPPAVVPIAWVSVRRVKIMQLNL